METRSLAVIYRPKKLSDLIGQDHIAKQIIGMFKTNKMPSSIMLHGPTGLGKTTVARMIARMVNCLGERDETFTPCGECQSCKMDETPDVSELNAADARGIDDVRNLIQQSRNMPAIGKKRIIIIDEAQQFPTLSQQALLKPLEEPTSNTIWIICTMIPDKVIPAIAKRCLSLQVKPVDSELIVKRLYRIAKREGVDFKEITDGVQILKTIADFSNGGVRASVQLLESVLYAHHSGEELNAKSVLTKFLSGGEADIESAAANVLIAVLTGNMKLLVKSIPQDNSRSVLNKLRWLIDYIINKFVGTAKFVPYSGRIFAQLSKEHQVQLNLSLLLQIQNLLVETEYRLNNMSIDDRVVITSALGNFAALKQHS